jgi:hypothetical protein
MASDSKDPDVLLFKAFALGQLITLDVYGVKSKSFAADTTYDALQDVADGKKKVCSTVDDMLKIVPDHQKDEFRPAIERTLKTAAKEHTEIAKRVLRGRDEYFRM